jgi:hypothetical protein
MVSTQKDVGVNVDLSELRYLFLSLTVDDLLLRRGQALSGTWSIAILKAGLPLRASMSSQSGLKPRTILDRGGNPLNASDH